MVNDPDYFSNLYVIIQISLNYYINIYYYIYHYKNDRPEVDLTVG